MLPLRQSPSDIVQQADKYFRWRGGEVFRLESLFDAIIALAPTLIVVSVEVPSSFAELTESFRKLPAFAICFAILVGTPTISCIVVMALKIFHLSSLTPF